MSKRVSNIISCVDPLGFPFKTLDPFLFCVYHKDNYPAGDSKMQAPRKGNGADFSPNAPYRMYHGDRIPGFPQHPHRGFETVTATMEGIIDHSDSCGNAGRYGQGDLQWMTAGRGVVHGEMFPLVKQDAPNPTRFFQIWLNLPAKSKMVPPAFAMHWKENIPKITSEDKNSQITLFAGNFEDQTALAPPPNSWASNAASEIAILHITLKSNGSCTIPAAISGDAINRVIYFIEGSKLVVNQTEEFSDHCAVTLFGSKGVELSNPSDTVTEVLLLQGRPIGEPVAQHGPFVMNTNAEIQQAFNDYRQTQFGGWPWPKDAMVFPIDKGRFSLLDKMETYPPVLSTDTAVDNTCDESSKGINK